MTGLIGALLKLDKPSFEKYFAGYSITDCVVRARDMLYFVLEQEDDRGPPRTAVVIRADRPGVPAWSGFTLTGMHRMTGGVSYHPKEQFVGVTFNCHVYAVGSGERGFEDDLQGYDSQALRAANTPAGEYLLRGPIVRLRSIDGRLYGCGPGRTVIERNGKNNWRYHTSLPENEHFLDPHGFDDIDGVSSDDIYAVGGKGDIWHFDGQAWKQIPFPVTLDLKTVCCAPDGAVYIGAECGCVFKGRDHQWIMIAAGALSLPFTDMVWHDGALWCTNDTGLWTIRNDTLAYADVAPEISVCSGHLSVGDGVMLLAGPHGAALHDGKAWKRIIDYHNVE